MNWIEELFEGEEVIVWNYTCFEPKVCKIEKVTPKKIKVAGRYFRKVDGFGPGFRDTGVYTLRIFERKQLRSLRASWRKRCWKTFA